MDEFMRNASTIYLLSYFGMIVVVSLLEYFIPQRDAGDTLRLRWLGNISVGVLGVAVVRLLFPLSGLGLALVWAERGWGLLHWLQAPFWIGTIVTLTALDSANYARHYISHRVTFLWHIHRPHHSDQNFDFTTGLRFHPLEAILIRMVDAGVIAALGPAPAVILIVNLLDILEAFYGHANIRVPRQVDWILRLIIVTPDMHRIHHSEVMEESQSNFGNVFSLWDRLFKTYIENPSIPHDQMRIGLAECRERKYLTLPSILVQPFLRETHSQASRSELA
jgi:sterol desaturase/sphingolipid hydroxylase (fatty acid hydroxylase superfamily)